MNSEFPDSLPPRERGRLKAHGHNSLDGGPATLLVIHESGGVWTFHGPEGQVVVGLPRAEAIRLCRSILDRSMSTHPYDPWRDADGTPVTEGCRVEQIQVCKKHGAVPSRLHRQGQVVGRGNSRVVLLFDGVDRPVSVRPHLLRVITAQTGGADE